MRASGPDALGAAAGESADDLGEGAVGEDRPEDGDGQRKRVEPGLVGSLVAAAPWRR